jgi:hypothetical protein
LTVKVVPGESVIVIEPVEVDAYAIDPPIIDPVTFRLPPIPTPPGTMRAPVVADEDAVVDVSVTASNVVIGNAC